MWGAGLWKEYWEATDHKEGRIQDGKWLETGRWVRVRVRTLSSQWGPKPGPQSAAIAPSKTGQRMPRAAGIVTCGHLASLVRPAISVGLAGAVRGRCGSYLGNSCGGQSGCDPDQGKVGLSRPKVRSTAGSPGPARRPSGMEVLDEFDPEFPQSVTFCQRISKEDFERQAATYTERSLRRLFRSLDRNPALAERVVRMGKQAECERRGLLSFLSVRAAGGAAGE